MPIRVKYVGALDTKTFRGYFFVRDVSDDATGGTNAVELPDNIANDALKHRDVFMQWNLKVPQDVKALRGARVHAMRKEAEEGRSHWYKRLVVAEMLEDDSPRKRQIRLNEIAGAKAEVDRFEVMLKEADKLAERVLLEDYDPQAPAGTYQMPAQASPQAADDLLKLLAGFKEALQNSETANQQLRAELVAMKANMERDARLTPDEDVSAPNVGEAFVATTVVEDEEDEAPAGDTPAQPADFHDVFAPEPAGAAVATIEKPKRGRPPRAQ